MSAFADALADAGGAIAPRESHGRLRALLDRELERGAGELARPRSGYGDPIAVAIAAAGGTLLAAAPVPATLRADPHAADERAWLLVAALAGALITAGGRPLRAGALQTRLVLAAPGDDAELAALAFDENVAGVDRLRAQALAVPGALLEPAAADLREPIGPRHPLRVAAALASLGANPADPDAADEHEEALPALLGPDAHQSLRPHDDPDPRRRVARRILQRLAGMGKWGGYHTDFAHLARGFAGNDRALADDVGERLLKAGLLLEKPSVGQRHVFLNSRRAGDIYALIDDGAVPPDLDV